MNVYILHTVVDDNIVAQLDHTLLGHLPAYPLECSVAAHMVARHDALHSQGLWSGDAYHMVERYASVNPLSKSMALSSQS